MNKIDELYSNITWKTNQKGEIISLTIVSPSNLKQYTNDLADLKYFLSNNKIKTIREVYSIIATERYVNTTDKYDRAMKVISNV